MVRSCRLLSLGVLLLLPLLPLRGDFGPGGASLDFALYPPEKAVAAGENLLRNGSFEEAGTDLSGQASGAAGAWRGHAHVHAGGEAPGVAEFRRELADLAQRRLSPEEPASGRYGLLLQTPAQLLGRREPLPMVSNKISQTVVLAPSAAARKFRLLYRARGRTYEAPGYNGLSVFAIFAAPHPSGKGEVSTGESLQFRHVLTRAWGEGSADFVAPAGTERLTVTFALYGLGECHLDDLVLNQVERSGGVDVVLHPAEKLDKTYVLGEGLPGALAFVFHAEEEVKRRTLDLCLQLPPGFRLVDTNQPVSAPVEVVAAADGGSLCRIGLRHLSKAILKDYYLRLGVNLLVQSEHPAGETLYPASYWIEEESGPGVRKNFSFRIMPAFQAERPRQFRSAAMMGQEFNFSVERGGLAAIADFYLRSGFNCVHGSPNGLGKLLKQSGIERYAAPYYLSNGFRLGTGPHPETAQFRMVDGRHFPRKTCPVEVYQRGEYFRGNIVPMLEKLLVSGDEADHIMSNWEPYYLDSKGCFCERCRDEFIRCHPDLAAEEVRRVWPAEVIKTYGEVWEKFRSWQHGRLVVTLEQTINELGRQAGKDSHFIPEISWNSMMEHGNSYCRQYNVRDYFNELPWIDPWGPYIYHSYRKPYQYYPADHLTVWVAAARMQEFAAKIGEPGKGARLLALPHGVQGNDWVTEPESMAMDVLSFFLQKWGGAFIYYFPRGYDYRYWRALAVANTLIARHEELVYQGTEVTATVSLEGVTPLPEHLFYASHWAEGEGFIGRAPGLHQQGAVQVKAFRAGERTLVAVGNFWKKGEHFFRLRVGGLAGTARYSVQTLGTDCGEFSGQELGQGILLQAGAFGWQFFDVVPAVGAPAGKPVVTQAALQLLLAERLPQIQAACQWEKEHWQRTVAADAAEKFDNDYAALPTVTGAGVTLQGVSGGVQVSAAAYTLMIDPDVGGRIRDWRAGGADGDLLSWSGKTEGIGVHSFWWPKEAAGLITASFKLGSASVREDGVELVLSRTLTPRDNLVLAGLELLVTYRFRSDGFRISSSLRNTMDDALQFSFRYHNMPAALGVRDGKSGQALFADGARFSRDFYEKLYQFAEPDHELEKAFRMDKVLETKSSSLTLSAPWLSRRVRVELPADQLQCYVFWDAGKQAVSTFEPIFRKITLAPGAEVQYYQDWTVLSE